GENDRGINQYDEIERAHEDRHAGSTKEERPGVQTPPRDFAKPDREEDVVDVDAAGPPESVDRGRLIGRRGDRSRVIPAVAQVKRRDEGEAEKTRAGTQNGPRQGGGWGGGRRAPLTLLPRHEAGEREPDCCE